MRGIVLVFIVLLSLKTGQAKVYKNVPVGEFSSVLKLVDYKGKPLLQFMQDIAYPEFNRQAAEQRRGSHITGVRQGEGVEIQIIDGVTTFHVKYKADWEDKVERSGRSFSAVGQGERIDYVADASYKHYLRSLGPIVQSDDDEVQRFYSAILAVIANSDPSGFYQLRTKTKQVAADFVAIYIAEQYRRLTATKGLYLGKRHRWDDAVTQVTLLAAFHGGQGTNMKMFYEGEFVDQVYHQSACLYRASAEEPRREQTSKRPMRLYDYWQFSTRNDCPGRSGVNLTRRDFEKLGQALTSALSQIDEGTFDAFRSMRGNFFKAETKRLLRGSLNQSAEDYVKEFVKIIMLIHRKAKVLTTTISQ